MREYILVKVINPPKNCRAKAKTQVFPVKRKIYCNYVFYLLHHLCLFTFQAPLIS